MDNAEHKIIKLLLDKQFYEENKHRVVRTMFPDSLSTIYDTIIEGHRRYARSMTLDELRALHMTLNPAMTRAQRNNISELLVDIQNDEALGPDIAKDVLQYLWKNEVFRQVAEIAVDGMAGKVESLQPIQRIFEQHGEDFLPVEDVVEVDSDLDAIFDGLQDRAHWRFNLPSLTKHIPGAAGGDFIIVFARPEVGKTAFHVSIACGPDGFCSQGADVHILGNEESGVRTLARAVSSWTGMTADQINENRDMVRPLWNSLREKYHLIDHTDMTMERLDAYCKRHKPDILIVDQLDKVHLTGSFARVDQKLREIYRQAREIAKRHNCLMVGVSQASADAEGKTKLSYAMMEESKTGKAAEADVIIGIGKRSADEERTPSEAEDRLRFLTISKNKLTGWHGTVTCVLENDISQYHA